MSETSFCGHCKRDVPSVSFTLHAAHCERFMQVCSKCQEPVHKGQIEQHDQDFHTITKCNDCQQAFEKRASSNHIETCPKRLVPCQYCEVDCNADKIGGHEVACGSRTEKCELCDNHILVKMWKYHEELHKEIKNTPTEHEVKNSDQRMPGREQTKSLNKGKTYQSRNETEFSNLHHVLSQDTLQASAVLPSYGYTKNEKVFRKDTNSGRNEEVYYRSDFLGIPCEFCTKPCSIETLEEHQFLCSSNVKTCPLCSENVFGHLVSHTCSSKAPPVMEDQIPNSVDDYWSNFPTSAEMISDDEPSIPCETCGNLYPITCLELHEIACKFSIVSTRAEVSTSTNNFNSSASQKVTKQLLTGDEEDYWSCYAADSHTDDEEASIPCECCGELFPLSCLELHKLACMFGGEELPQESEIRETETKSSLKRGFQKAIRPPVEELFPCSFCNVVMTSNILELHEARCKDFLTQKSAADASAAATRTRVPKTPVVKNVRPESDSQRALRENALLATTSRLPTTPKIQQSQYAVVQLPDGREILKKKNPTLNSNDLDIGHVLGRDSSHHSIRNDPSVRSKQNIPKADYFERRLCSDPNRKSDYAQFSNVPMRSSSIQDPIKNDTTKKPNSSFVDYAYQPDPGNRLGRKPNQNYATTTHNGAINKNRFDLRNSSTNASRSSSAAVTSVERRSNLLNGTAQEFRTARDRNFEESAGAKPKRPSKSQNNF